MLKVMDGLDRRPPLRHPLPESTARCARLTTKVTNVREVWAVFPVTCQQPSVGKTTPLAWNPMYPALRRLELRGLVRAQAPASQAGQPARHRRVYEPTQPGQAAHMDWLRTPVEPATASRDLGLHLMRFVMMEHLLAPEEVLAFLQDLADALTALTTQLERYAVADLTDRHPRLALDHGVAVHRASLQWAERTLAALSAAPLSRPTH